MVKMKLMVKFKWGKRFERRGLDTLSPSEIESLAVTYLYADYTDKVKLIVTDDIGVTNEIIYKE